MEQGPIGRDASFEQIRRASDALLGHTTREITRSEIAEGDPVKLKGQFGELLEIYYGMENDNDPLPDFRSAGLELKCKPLKISYEEYLYPKEPLSVGMIDYGEVADTEYWRDIEKLEKKFLNLLIVWFLHEGEGRGDFPFIWWQQWSPSEHHDEQIQSEYEEIRRQILDGEHLSETKAGNDILQTCPKHNYDFSSREPGSFVVNSGHPHLEKPERRSWRIPTRFLVKMLADDADLPLTSKGGTEYIEEAALWNRAMERASQAGPLEQFLPGEPGQSDMDDYPD